MNEELVECINLNIPNVEHYRVEVTYHTLPDGCFACKKRVHLARNCPGKSQIVDEGQTSESSRRGVQQRDDDGLHLVPRKQGRHNPMESHKPPQVTKTNQKIYLVC